MRTEYQNKQSAITLIRGLLIYFALTACVPTPSVSGTNVQWESHQSAYTASQATLAAGQVQAQELANQSTVLAIELIQAAATSTSFFQETAHARQVSATAQAQASTETQSTHNITATAQEAATLWGITQTAAVEQTQAVQATQTAQAIQTATTWPQTATPLAATQAAIVAETIATERRSYWSQYVIPFWVFIGAVVLVLILVATGYTFKRLLPVWELRARTIISPDGEVITYLPAHNNIKAILPGRAFGPALHSQRDQSQVSGLAPDLSLQDRALERHQATRLAASLPPRRSTRSVQRLLNTSTHTPGERPTPYHVLQSGERPPLLDSDTLEILEGQWREIHD
ncbi:MAG: hypothetical protein ISS57_05820 [Anaerolineales bacterium]|nr:hypothetical protein [Anaerolineales bacterium]